MHQISVLNDIKIKNDLNATRMSYYFAEHNKICIHKDAMELFLRTVLKKNMRNPTP